MEVKDIKFLTKDEIIEELKKMRVDTGEYPPIKGFSVAAFVDGALYLLKDVFFEMCITHQDEPKENGVYVRDYNHERVLKKIDDVIEKYGGIYKII